MEIRSFHLHSTYLSRLWVNSSWLQPRDCDRPHKVCCIAHIRLCCKVFYFNTFLFSCWIRSNQPIQKIRLLSSYTSKSVKRLQFVRCALHDVKRNVTPMTYFYVILLYVIPWLVLYGTYVRTELLTAQYCGTPEVLSSYIALLQTLDAW